VVLKREVGMFTNKRGASLWEEMASRYTAMVKTWEKGGHADAVTSCRYKTYGFSKKLDGAKNNE
jgi:hypothetical protein